MAETDTAASSPLTDVLANSVNSPNVPPPQAQTAPAPPDASILGGGTPGPATSALGGAQAPPPKPAGTPSVWKDVAMGALWGIMGAAGSKHFGEGVGRGVGGVVEEKRHEEQLQFESVRAADTHILASKQAAEADAATEDHKANLIIHQQQANEWADEHGQPRPFSLEADNPADMHAQAVGGLKTLANANGGQVPAITTTNAPVGKGQDTHKIDVYAPTTTNVQAQPNAALTAINLWRKIQNPDAPDISWKDLQVMGGQVVKGNVSAGIARLWQDAQQNIIGLPPLSTANSVAAQSAENSATAAHLDQQLKRYKASPNADATTVKTLQAQLDAFNSSAENARSKASAAASKTELEGAPAKAEVAKQEELAKESTPGGKAALVKSRVEAEKASFELSQEKRDASSFQQPDPTGFTPSISLKEYDKRYDAFTKSKQFQTLQTLQGSYQQFQDTVAHIAQTGEMTGAESVVGLFNAIGISATPLAGKGFRINNNTVQEHVEARGIGQAGYQKLLSLKNGDVITPKQLTDYSSIATDVYHHAFVNAVDEAHRQGLPADFLPTGGGKAPDAVTARIYAESVLHTNPKLTGNPAALKAAVVQAEKAKGWAVPGQ